MPRMSFTVSLVVPKDLARREVADYIADAVANWKGQFFQGTFETNFTDRDPLFDLHSVVVRDKLKRTVTKG